MQSYFYKESSTSAFMVYHDTTVASLQGKHVTLCHGGWLTATTKKRMNEFAKEMGLPFTVYQKAKKWFVSLPSPTLPLQKADPIPFETEKLRFTVPYVNEKPTPGQKNKSSSKLDKKIIAF